MALGNLAQRFLVAVVAVPILLFIVYLDRPEPTWALIFVASLLAMHEYFTMTLPKEDRRPAIVMGALAVLAFYWIDPKSLSHPFGVELSSRWLELGAIAGKAVPLVFAVIVPGLYYLFRFRDIPSVAHRFGHTVTGIIYAGFFATFIAMLKQLPHGGHLVILVLAIAWLADTGGYFAGRFLGKAKLYEAVSPKKTWAGAYGGLAGSLAGVIGMKLAFLDSALSWVDVFAIAIPASILGQLGDLTESLIKRSVNVKDSGALLPGHGGILDRVDAVLFIAPYVYGYVTIKFSLLGWGAWR